MKEKKTLILRLLRLISLIILYYIVGNKSIFLYALSLSLYNIFISCLDHITIQESFKRIENISTKNKLFKILLLIITIISLFFLLLSITVSDLLSLLLKIDGIKSIFIIMGISIIIKPLIKLLCEYLANIKNRAIYLSFIKAYEVIDNILMLIIALFSFRILNLKPINAIFSLYLSKIIAMFIIVTLIYQLNKYSKTIKLYGVGKINYRKEIKKILFTNSNKSIISIIKKSYYYISIILLYLILSTRYNYQLSNLEKIIVFMYFYVIEIIDYIVHVVGLIIKKISKDSNITNNVYYSFKIMTPIAITLGIIAPLISKAIFNNYEYSIYLSMMSFLSIFILLYDTVTNDIKNKYILNISLLAGIISKIVLIIPLINSFYRMGYNLIYGDIFSTIIAMSLTITINYLHVKKATKNEEKYFERILKILYENILLAIILILMQFIIPISGISYIKSLGLTIIYIIVSTVFIKIINKK